MPANTTPDHEIRVLVNQCGAQLELHRAGKEPVVLTAFSPTQIQAYGAKLARENPDMKYASIGQVALVMARTIAKHDCLVNPHLWDYNASTKEYSYAN